MSLVLASASRTRQSLLENAGIGFESVPSTLDERAAEQPLIEAGASPQDLALALAMAKAVMVSGERREDLVIGADQVLEFDGERLTKPADMEAARRMLLRLAGRTHLLHSALAAARGGEVVWQHEETARLTMRRLQPAAIGRYLAAAGDAVLSSVGAYQIEGRGIGLFERIEGDYFAILGLPLLPLLAFLRSQGVIE
jgi:septum formation protein